MNYLDKIFKEQQVFSESGKSIPLDSNISFKEAVLLFNVITEIKPERSAEIGFAQGISTLAILEAIKKNGKGKHSVIDPYQNEYENSGKEMVARAGLDSLYEFYSDFPENVFPRLKNIDFVFIDASHLFGLSVLDFIFSDRALKIGGVIGFHDLDIKAISKLLKYILGNYDYNILNEINGINIYKKKFREELFDSARNFIRTIYYELKKPIRFWGIGNLIFIQKTGSANEKYRELKNF